MRTKGIEGRDTNLGSKQFYYTCNTKGASELNQNAKCIMDKMISDDSPVHWNIGNYWNTQKENMKP